MYKRGSINLGQPINWQSPLNRGLVGWWRVINQGAHFGGARLLDLTGKNHGTLANGPKWAGRRNSGGDGSLYFENANPPTEAAVPNTATSYANWTIRLWFYAPSSGAGDPHFIGNNPDGAMSLNGANLATWTGGAYLQTAGGWSYDTWTSYGLTGDGTNIRFYSQGQLISTQANAHNRGQIASIGRYYSASGLTGWMDHVSMWSRTLSDGEMAQDYQEAVTGCRNTLNRFTRPLVFDVGGTPATTSPWYYYAQQ